MSPIPTPVDRDTIRAEVWEKAARIADELSEKWLSHDSSYPANVKASGIREAATAIRSAAKTEASR